MNKKQALIVFAREPKPGQVKTRLLTNLDVGFVTDLYRAFIQDVMHVALDRPDWTPMLYYADREPDPPFLARYRAQCHVRQQQGEDLGERMHQAAADCFAEGFDRVVIIGTDCLDLTREDMVAAFECLHHIDFCLGPSTDGGYYLIGMRVIRSEPFRDVQWGTDTVLTKTLEKVDQIEHNVNLLPEKEDIDTLATLRRFARRMEAAPIAPYTTQYIRENQQCLPEM